MVNNNAFIYTLLIIATIIIIIIVVWAVQKNKKAKEKNKKTIWPPNDYMKTLGSKCPDYWTYLGVDKSSGGSICQNKFNITVANSTQYGMCYDDKSGYENVKVFNTIEQWPIPSGKIDQQLSGLPGHKDDYAYPCNWIKACGPTDKTHASWLGITEKCVNL